MLENNTGKVERFVFVDFLEIEGEKTKKRALDRGDRRDVCRVDRREQKGGWWL